MTSVQNAVWWQKSRWRFKNILGSYYKIIFQEKREGHKKIFKIIDKDHDGYIDMEEIKAWWKEEDSSRSVLKAMEDLWSMDSK